MPTIKISLSPENDDKTFRKKGTLITFLEQEKEYWAGFFEERTPTTNISYSTNAIKSNLFTQLTQAITKAKEIDNGNLNIHEIQNQISKLYLEKRLVFSKSAFASFLETQDDQTLSIYVLGSYLTDGFQNTLYANNGNIINSHFAQNKTKILEYYNESAILKMMFEHGYHSDNLNHEKRSLVTLKNEWDDVLIDVKNKSDNQDDRFTKLESSTLQCQNDTNDLFGKHKKRFAKFMIDSKKSMKDFEDFYEKELAMKSAVTYWRRKKFISYGIAITLGLALSVIGYFTIDYLFGLSNTIGESLKNVTDSNEKTTNPNQISSSLKYLPIFHFLVISTFAIWGIRILVKIFLSKLHAADNASEKEMFIKSYLALLNEHQGSVVDEKDRQLILQAIFSPSSDGLISDEGPKLTDLINSIRK